MMKILNSMLLAATLATTAMFSVNSLAAGPAASPAAADAMTTAAAPTAKDEKPAVVKGHKKGKRSKKAAK